MTSSIITLVLLASWSAHSLIPTNIENKNAKINSRKYLLPNEKTPPSQPPKQRTITPNDIESLFGAYTPKSARKIESEVDELEFDMDDDEENDEEEEEEEEVFITTRPTSSSSSSANNIRSKTDGNTRITAELELLESMSMSSYTEQQSVPPRSSTATTTPSTIVTKKEAVGVVPGLEYLDLEQTLDANTQASIRGMMSLVDDDNDESSSVQQSPRVFQYDPSESNAMYDPMNFGAYNRWKKAEIAVEKANAKKNPKKKAKEGLSPDSFYNAIKNLGSGPKSKNEATGVGVAEPPPGRSPVTPKKGLAKKNKKKVITPEEIDSLFGTRSSSSSQSGSSENAGESNNDKDVFSPMLRDDEEVPQWIVDAEKAAKKQRQMRGKKQRKITDDWRFWAAIIGAVGFASAFFSVYQQNGGFDNTFTQAAQELII